MYAQFNRQHVEPSPDLGPNATEAERWLAEDLDVFEGIEQYMTYPSSGTPHTEMIARLEEWKLALKVQK